MIQLILFLFIGALLLLSLLILARRSSRPEGGAETLVVARQALIHLRSGLLPPELIGRLLAAEDFQYVAASAPRAIYLLFNRERKRLVLGWTDALQQQIRSLRRFHLGAARFYSRLSIRSEISLAFYFMSLLVACRVLKALVYLGGPLMAPRMVGATAAAASRVCEVSEQCLAFLTVPNANVLADRRAAS